MKHFLSVYLSFLTLNNDPLVKWGDFGVSASNVVFIPRTIGRTELDHHGPNQIQEESPNVNLLAVLFGDEFQVFLWAHFTGQKVMFKILPKRPYF